MKCRQARLLLADSLNEPLTSRQQQRLDEHLKVCARCRALLAWARTGAESVRRLPADEPASGFWQRLKPRLPSAPRRWWSWLPVPAVSTRRRAEVALPLAVATVAVLAVVCWRPVLQQSAAPASPSTQSLYVLQCVEQHASYGGDNSLCEEVLLVDTGNGSSGTAGNEAR